MHSRRSVRENLKAKVKTKVKRKAKAKIAKAKKKARNERIRRARTTKVLAKILPGRKLYASVANAIGGGASATKKPRAGSRVPMTIGPSTTDSHGRQAAAVPADQKPKLTKNKVRKSVLRGRGQVMPILWQSLQTFLHSSSSQ